MHAPKHDLDQVERSFKDLSKKVNGLGYRTQIQEGLSILELASHYVLHLTFFGLGIYFRDQPLLSFGFFFLMMLSGIGITTGTHTASHHCLVKSKSWNDFFVYLGYGFFFGASYQYWMYKHIKVHHPHPNITGVDEDINLMPFFVMNQEDYAQASPGLKRWFRLQFLIIPFALTLNLFNVQKDSVLHLINEVKRNGMSRKVYLDITVMLSHFLGWVIIPSLFFGFPTVFLFYLIRAAFMGYGMFFAFAPAHFPHNALFFTKENKRASFILKQVYGTTNFSTGLIGRYILGGVQYQIEHHLFPKCHHYHYGKINTLLIAYCQENDLPYNEMGWMRAIWESFKVFYVPKEVYSSFEEGAEALEKEPKSLATY